MTNTHATPDTPAARLAALLEGAGLEIPGGVGAREPYGAFEADLPSPEAALRITAERHGGAWGGGAEGHGGAWGGGAVHLVADDEVDARWARTAAEFGIGGGEPGGGGPDGGPSDGASPDGGLSGGAPLSGGSTNGDGAFLVAAAVRHVPLVWSRVRPGPGWSPAALLVGDRGRFVAVTRDGSALLGACRTGDGVRLVAFDRLPDRREEAARSEAAETPAQRAAAWAGLFRDVTADDALRLAWAEWLGFNRAAPDDVLVRIARLRVGSLRPRRDLPPVATAALATDPDWRVRAELAEAGPDLTPDQWSALFFTPPEPRHPQFLVERAAWTGADLAPDTYERLAAHPRPAVRAAAAELPGLPAPLATRLADDPLPAVRAAACPAAWPHLDPPARRRLLDDPAPVARRAALLAHHEEHPLPRALYDAENLGERAVRHCRLERDLAEHLAAHPDRDLREHLAANPHLPPDLVAALGHDPDDAVRLAVSVRPELTEDQRASVPYTFDARATRRTLPWVAALHDDPDAMRRCAASAHPLLRGSAARARRLPPDVAERLARDEDRVVRLFLAESCDDAPADLLLEVWRWWDGSFSHPDRPRGHPNFPRTDLLRYTDDPSPRMRRLAPDDPESTPELVERLSRDPAAEVRCRAAEDPRLSPATAVRLLDDVHARVRAAAARNPNLPARTLVRVLRDRTTLRDAATNPGLPVRIMRRMLEGVGPRR
ncbi:PE-PGRS family protein [Streptomyces thermolilacinus]|uniref:PE-PGRS family protein n=1 Tax=Streptomyces thermolilacinus TaxID=285540 RepID=UPI0034029054